MTTDARRRPRGFTLLELAVVLAVLGLLLGMSLTPARMLEERRQLRQETQLLQTAHDAVVGYALQNQTRERVVYIKGAVDKTVTLRPGRPYLPCPDWNGDGYEDRMPEGQNGFVQGLEVNPAFAITIFIERKTIVAFRAAATVATTLDYLAWVDDSGHPTHPYGECTVSRGSLPWRTLGVEPADSWGNRHTYYADRVFSNAIFGFDRQTHANIYDPRISELHGVVKYSPRTRTGIVDDVGCPAVMCDGKRSDDCNFPAPPSAFSFEKCAWGIEGLELKSGAVARDTLEIESQTTTLHTPGDVTSGLPFVLVAHGPNGRFAVNHWGTMRNPLDESGEWRPICNDWEWHLVRLNDSENKAALHEAMNGARITPDGERCGEADGFSFNHSAFVWEPPRFDEPKGFDDVVMWMTREELAAAMPDGIPPATPMIVSPR